jgi:hypothetical protein
MNPFDAQTQGLNGIGSDLKKVGRSIDRSVRHSVSNIGGFIEDSIKNIYKTQGDFFTATVKGKLSKAGQELIDGVKDQYELTEDAVKAQNHIRLDLQRATIEFLATDIGKIIAVIAVCVAMVMGAGPIVLEGLKQAMLAAKAGAQFAIKAGAKYLAKQLTVKAMAKRAASYAVKKVVRNYAEGKAQDAAVRAEAEYEAQLEAQYEKEYEAMIEKQYRDAYGVDFAAAIETPKAQVLGPDKLPVPYGMDYKYIHVPQPTSYGRSGPTQESIDQWRFGTQKVKEAYAIKKRAYLNANPKIAAMYEATKDGIAANATDLTKAAASIDENAREEMMVSLDAAIATASQISNSPEVVGVMNQLKREGKSDAEIKKIWASSELFKDSTKLVLFDASMPAVKNYVKNVKEYPPEIQADVETIIANNVAEIETQKAVAREQGVISPALLIGGLAALFMVS